MTRSLLLVLAAFAAQFLWPELSQAQLLPPGLFDAVSAMETGKATMHQKALLFANNDLVNAAAMGGFISENAYQIVQQDFHKLNQNFAVTAARTHGADFKVQDTNFPGFTPGTDSDYILKVGGENPVERIGMIRDSYNARVNEYLGRYLSPEDYAPGRNDWHRQLDVDFMADPRYVSDADFKRLADRTSIWGNNDGYSRRNAARYEALVRGKPDSPLPDRFKGLSAEDLLDERMRSPLVFEAVTDGEGKLVALRQPDELTDAIARSNAINDVSPEVFKDYVREMVDFTEYKASKLAKLTADPKWMDDPLKRVEAHRMMAQQQKYISRIEEANTVFRQKAGLPVKGASSGTTWVAEWGDDGMVTFKENRGGTMASRGSKRRAPSFDDSLAGYKVYDQSMTNAIQDLADSMVDAAHKDFAKWGDGLKEFGELTDGLPDSQIQKVIERSLARGGERSGDIAKKLAESVQTHRASKKPTLRSATRDAIAKYGGIADTKLKGALDSVEASVEGFARGTLGVASDGGSMSKMRSSFNEQAEAALGKLDNLGKLGTAAEVLTAASQFKTLIASIYAGVNAETDAEADAAFAKAHQAQWELMQSGGIGVITEAIPTLGVAYGGWTIGYGGGRYVLENTETGQRFERWKADITDRHVFAAEQASNTAMEAVGLESARQEEKRLDEEQKEDLKQSFWKALRNGTIKLRSGAKTLDIADMIEDGNLRGIRDWIEPGPNASKDTIERLLGKQEVPRDLTTIEVNGIEAFGKAQQFGDDGLPSEDMLEDAGLFGGPGSFSDSFEEADRKRQTYRDMAARATALMAIDFTKAAAEIEQQLKVRDAQRERERQAAIAREQERERQRRAAAANQRAWEAERQRQLNEQIRQRQLQQQLYQNQQNRRYQQYVPQQPRGPMLDPRNYDPRIFGNSQFLGV